MNKSLLVIAAMLACSAPSLAEENEVSYGAPDPANIKCFQVLTMLERSPQGSEQQFYTWAQGYFAGRAASDSGFSHLPEHGSERDKVFATIVDYCEENPDNTYFNAVEVLAESRS